MADSLNKLQGLSFINKYLKDLGVNKTVTGKDVLSIFEKLEKNEDGTIDTSVFALAVANEYSNEDLTLLENDYLEAWSAISGLDGNNESISVGDLSGLDSDETAEDISVEETSSPSSGSSSGSGSSGTGKTDGTVDDNVLKSNVQAAKVTGKETVEELQASRSDSLAQLSEALAQKENNAQIQAAKAEADAAEVTYNEAMMAFEENEAELFEQIEELNTQREENDAAISEKKSEVDDVKNNISDKEAAISEVRNELSALVEPNKSDYAVEDADGNVTYPGYEEALAEYEQQKQALEEQIIGLEDELTDLQALLAEREEALSGLEERSLEINRQIYDTMLSEQMQNNEYAKAVEEALAAYLNAKNNVTLTEQQELAQLNVDIAQLRENVNIYDNAIDKAETKESEEDGSDDESDITLEEFLDSIEDPQTRDFYERLYELYDFDDFNNRSDIPQYFQTVYTNAFSNGTIRSAGCGITSLAMIASYLSGEEITPDMLTNGYMGNNPASAMHAGIRNLGLNLTTYEGWGNATQDMNGDGTNNLDAALDAGKPVIARMGSNSIFTNGGHFIVIAGKTEDGKYIVNDPNLENYYNPNMVEGFTNGFTREEIINGLNGIYILETN